MWRKKSFGNSSCFREQVFQLETFIVVMGVAIHANHLQGEGAVRKNVLLFLLVQLLQVPGVLLSGTRAGERYELACQVANLIGLELLFYIGPDGFSLCEPSPDRGNLVESSSSSANTPSLHPGITCKKRAPLPVTRPCLSKCRERTNMVGVCSDCW